MRFDRISLQHLLAEITELPAGWLDEKGQAVLLRIAESVHALEQQPRPIQSDYLAQQLATGRHFLDVCRLFLGMSQDQLTNAISDHFVKQGDARRNWAQIERLQRTNPDALAKALVELGTANVINEYLAKNWTLVDILTERYRQSRGRAVAGQKRGRSIEDEIEAGLKMLSVPYARRISYTGFKGHTAKCDFAIPSRHEPKIVIEAKGFEATGSKQTDVLGDVMKIIDAKAPHTYFFVVTDGRGWHNRTSDLQRLVDRHHEGDIDMIFTRVRLPELNLAIKHILDNE